MQEFVFLKNENLIPLLDDVKIIDKIIDDEVLISNDERLNSCIYAPEINFYLKNSNDDDLTKAKNISILYKARLDAYELGLDFDNEKEVGKNIVLISDENNEKLINLIKENDFKIICLKEREVISVFGSVGELCVIILKDNEQLELDCDFILYDKKREVFTRQSGVYDIKDFKNNEDLISFLKEKTPNYKYKNYISYNESICQYHKRRTKHCAKCAEICPTVAIINHDDTKELEFSQIDCLGCGGCISICPSGALDYNPMPINSFLKIARMYKEKKILIISEKMSLQNLDLTLPKDVLPFMIKGEKWLSQTHFLSLLQISGANLIFYSDFISKGSNEAINMLNEIFKRKFNKQAIFVAKNEEQLKQVLNNLEFIPNLIYDFNEYNMLKREIFAKRLEYLIANDDLGIIESGEWIRYGQIKINEKNCTLCLSCVGSCNVGALIADNKENSLKFNASLCTTCGYCEASCAEKDTLELFRDGIRLNKEYFKFHALAKDELFACVVCNKEFATKKAVEKIANLMKDKFANDEAKLKTLYCCSDCKAKVMLESIYNKTF